MKGKTIMTKEKTNDDIEFDFFEPDKNRLDEEWVNQPKIYYEFSEKLTDAKEEVERCKARLGIAEDDLKVTKAKLSLRIRRNPEKYFGEYTEKLTEAAIENRILVHSLYAKAKAKIYKLNEELIAANRTVSTFYSAVHALDHRKSALERLVSLHGQNYFSTPKPIDEHSVTTATDIENRSKKKRRQAGLKGKKRKEK